MSLTSSRTDYLNSLGIDPDALRRQALAPLSSIIPLSQSKISSVSSMMPTLPQNYTVGLPEGYTIADIGVGKHNILDPTGNIIGVGYDDLDTTLLEMQKQHLLGGIQEHNIPAGDGRFFKTPAQTYYTSPYFGSDVVTEAIDGGMWNTTTWEPTKFNSREALEAELAKYYATPDLLSQVYGPSDWSGITSASGIPMYGDAAKWEALGIMLNPELQKDPNAGGFLGRFGLFNSSSSTNPIYTPIGSTSTSNLSPYAAQLYGLPRTDRSNTPGTPAIETISGEHTLYGSKPVFGPDGQLLGYQMNTALFGPDQIAAINAWEAEADAAGRGANRLNTQVGPYGGAYQWNRTSSSTQSSLGREYLPGWGMYAAPIDDYNLFVPTSNVSNLPGFQNKSSYDYENWAGGSWLDNMMDNPTALALMIAGGFALGPLAGYLGGAGGATLGSTIAAGGIIGGTQAALTGGNVLKGALTGGAGAGLGSYISTPGGVPQNYVGPTTNLGANLTQNAALQQVINRGISGGLTGALGSGLYGGDVSQGSLAGLTGGATSSALGGGFLGNYAGSTLGRHLFPQPMQTASSSSAPAGTAPAPLQTAVSTPSLAGISALPPLAQQRILSIYGAMGNG